MVSSGENVPSRQAKETFAELGGESDVQLDKLKKIKTEDIPELNKLIMTKQVPLIGIKE